MRAATLLHRAKRARCRPRRRAVAAAAVRWIGTFWGCSPSWLALDESPLYTRELCQHVDQWAVSTAWTNEPRHWSRDPTQAQAPKHDAHALLRRVSAHCGL